MSTTINLIGAGRVGQTLIQLIKPLSDYTLQAICSQHYNDDTVPIVASVADLPPADIFLLTVTDQQMAATAQAVCQHFQHTTLAQCSAALPAAMLNPDNREDLQVASVHPPICVLDPTLAVKKFAQGFCCIEGDEPAVKQLTQLFESFGTTLHRIDAEKKIAYHAGIAIIGNYLVTLADATHQQLTAIGLDKGFSKQVVEQLMDSVVDNLRSKDNYRDALTGPIARGDAATVKKHIASLKPELKPLYCQMGLQTVELTHHPEETKQALRQALQ
jgi:predicted short-subunit dehydrogenase-like oxidoreductase (DUF2520 family)